MDGSWTNGIDLALLHAVNGWAGNFALDHLVKQVEENPLLRGALFLTAFWGMWFHRAPKTSARRERLLGILFAVVAAVIAARAVSLLFPFRVRPMYADGVGFVPLPFPVQYNLEDWSSFPSDTGAYFFAIAVGFWFFSRPLSIVAMLYTALYICGPRLYLGIHWASDLLAGCLVGAAVTPFVVRSELVARLLSRPLIRFAELRPGIFYAAFFLFTFEMVPLFTDARGIFHGLMLMAGKYGLPIGTIVALVAAVGTAVLAACALYVARILRDDRAAADAAD